MNKVLITGSGPAGISASLYLARAGIDVTVVSAGRSSLEKADKIENYFGFAQPISGRELLENGKAGAKRLGVKFRDAEIVDLRLTEEMKYEAFTPTDSSIYDCVLLATGSQRKTPDIKGLKEFEGKGVSYCAICDAFFHRGKPTAVIGNGDYALHEAEILARTSSCVTILTNGSHPEYKSEVRDNIWVNEKKILEIAGKNKTEYIIFDDNSRIEVSGIFIAVGTAGSTELAKKIGAAVDGNHIAVDKNMASTIPGLYAAGDCTGGLLQISKAVSDGANAAMSIIKYLKSENNK